MNPTPEHAELEAKKTRQSREGKSALMLSHLEEQQNDAERAAQAAEASGDAESLEVSKIRLEVAARKRELFFREHDSTGAWKGERLGRDLARDMNGRSWERDAEGLLPKTPEDERSHLLLINMGELDRLNASGDHSLGDQGLRLSAERIEKVAREVLARHPDRKDDRRLAEAYDVYRHAGNYFALDLRNVDASDAEEIRRRLTQEPVDVSSARAGEEPVPLTASRISRADGIDLLNRLDSRPADVGLSDQKVLITAMLEKAQTLLDIEIIESRTKRMIGKIQEGGPQGEAAAKDFYEKFLKKSLGGAFKPTEATDAIGFESFKRLLEEKRAFESSPPAEWTHFVAERSMDSAFESLKARRSIGRDIELNLARTIASDVLKRSETFGRAIEGEDHPVSTRDFESPLETSGKELISRLKAEADAMDARRSEGTIADAQADAARVNADLEKAKRDERTGLYGRGAYFETMERAMAEKKPVTTVAIDMAFLRYFDKEGGPAAGDLAIAKSAEILDTIARTFSNGDVKVDAYRVGGDEFALTVVGGDDAVVKNVLAFVETAEKNAGRVPAQPGAKATYVSEGLQFNYGVRTAQDMESFRKELEQAKIPLAATGTEGERNELADYLVRLADKEVEIQKGVNRIMLLTGRVMASKTSGDRGNLDTLIAYSQKSIFGDVGVQKINELADRLASSANARAETGKIRGEVLAFVIEQIDAKNRQVADFESSLDRRMEDAVRIRYFENRISDLEEEIDMLHAQIGKEKESNVHLREAKTAAEEERSAIIQLRERMRGEPPSTREPPSVRQAA